MDFTPHEMSGEMRRLSKNLRTKYAKPKMKNTTSSHPRRSGGVRLELGFKKRKCLQSRTRRLRGGKKTYPRVTSPFFLAEPRWSSFPFLLPREKKKSYFF